MPYLSKTKADTKSIGSVLNYLNLLYDVALDLIKELSALVAVDVQCQLLGQVKAEDAHDGLCVDCISAADDVHVILALCYDVYEILYVIDGIDADLCCCHDIYFLSFMRVLPN